ncbi:MAG TPA: DUF4013 domain-containing protein [Candidatus Methanoperedens sp.]
MDITEEVKFPTKDSEWMMKVLIGGIIGIIPIVNLISYGYSIKVMKGAIGGNPGLPKWEDWGDLFVKGLMAFIIELIYMIIPILVIGISVGGALMALFTGNFETFMAALAGAIGGVLIGLILALIALLLTPMAISMYVKEDSIGAAFKIGEVMSRIKSVIGDYIMVYIILIVLGVILGILSIIPILNILIIVFGSFYIMLIAYNMFGKVYAKSKA